MPEVDRDLLGRRTARPATITDAVAVDQIIDLTGFLHYLDVDALPEYSAYNLTEKGWYAFASVSSGGKCVVSDALVVTGADGYAAQRGDAHVDLALRFEAAAVSKTVVIDWGGYTQVIVFHATDLAIRNLDYRTTFYVYDAAESCSFSYALTADETFTEGKNYYTQNGGAYELATVTAGETVPADTYYEHSKLTINGNTLTPNVTYKFDQVIDCPSEFILPAVDDDTHGCWYEIRMRHAGTYSTTLVPPTGDVKIATEHTQAETAGINMIDLHYSHVAGVKVWRFMNTHSTIPA